MFVMAYASLSISVTVGLPGMETSYACRDPGPCTRRVQSDMIVTVLVLLLLCIFFICFILILPEEFNARGFYLLALRPLFLSDTAMDR